MPNMKYMIQYDPISDYIIVLVTLLTLKGDRPLIDIFVTKFKSGLCIILL